MKKGWQTKTLEEVADSDCSLSYGIVQPGDEFVDGLPVVRPTDLTMKVIELSELKRIDPKLAAGYQRTTLQGGELLLCVRGSTGTISIASSELSGANVTRGIVPIRFKKTLLDTTFGYYLMIAEQVQSQIREKTYGAALMQINIRDLRNIVLTFPPLAEQQRIVGLLDEAFEGLATAKANAEKNLQNARALFESHLQSVFTQRGPGWKQKTLEEIATTFGRGKSKHRPRNEPKLYGGKYPFIQTGDIRNADHFITEYSQTYSELGLDQSKLWPKGTICITIAANIAETAILGFDACFPDSVIGVVANPKEAEVGFIEYLLQSFKARIQALGKGSAQANINMGTFENERFPFPPVAEQRQIVEKLDDLSEETQRLARLYERKLAALEALKKSLLHQAFTGEL